MKRFSTIFLQGFILFIGIGVLILMLWEPHLEGRNTNATNYDIYFNDPFLAYAYIVSIAFFVALYQAFKLVGFIRQNKLITRNAVKAIRSIKFCAISLAVCIVGAEAFFLFFQRGKDDIAGGVVLGFAMIVITIIIGAFAAFFEKKLQKAVYLKPLQGIKR